MRIRDFRFRFVLGIVSRRIAPWSSLIVKRDFDGRRVGQHGPVKPASPAGLRVRVHHPNYMLARRAGCTETCSSGSREARRRNPGFSASVVLRRIEIRVIPTFYPIPSLGKRATGKDLASKKRSEDVMVQRRCLQPWCCGNPRVGVRTKVPQPVAQFGWESREVRSTKPAWGAFVWKQTTPGQ